MTNSAAQEKQFWKKISSDPVKSGGDWIDTLFIEI